MLRIRSIKKPKYNLVIKHLVIDDLRVFDPPKSRKDVVYRRSLPQAMRLLRLRKVYVENLYLDFDLGHNDTTVPFVMALVASLRHRHERQRWVIKNIYITTMNPVGRQVLFELVIFYFPNAELHLVNPVEYNLVNKTKW